MLLWCCWTSRVLITVPQFWNFKTEISEQAGDLSRQWYVLTGIRYAETEGVISLVGRTWMVSSVGTSRPTLPPCMTPMSVRRMSGKIDRAVLDIASSASAMTASYIRLGLCAPRAAGDCERVSVTERLLGSPRRMSSLLSPAMTRSNTSRLVGQNTPLLIVMCGRGCPVLCGVSRTCGEVGHFAQVQER